MKALIALAGMALLAGPMLHADSKQETQAKTTATRSVPGVVNALNRKEEAACRNMDNAESATLWADDGVDLIDGLEPMVGKAAIVKWYESLTPQLKGAKMEYCSVEWQKIKIQGDWAWEWAVTRQKIDLPPPQKPVESNGKMLLILKRQADGQWKIELESWNSEPATEEKK